MVWNLVAEKRETVAVVVAFARTITSSPHLK
jgi:hypothetical protein